VYYRGGTVTTGPTEEGRGHDVRAHDGTGVPRGTAPDGREHSRGAYSNHGIAVAGSQPPPVPYRDGPPIIAVPRATVPGFPAGPPIIKGPPPLMTTPPPTIGAPPPARAPAPPTAHPAPLPRATPPAQAPPPPASTNAPAHAVPRSGSPK
jgi:hypothetical protein